MTDDETDDDERPDDFDGDHPSEYEDSPNDSDSPSSSHLANPFIGDDEPDFSLEDLSKAYAKIRQANPAADNEAANVPDDSGFDDADNETVLDSDGIDSLDDQVDNQGAPVNEHSIVEAILFVGAPQGEPLTAKKIASALRDVSPKEVKNIVEQLNSRYAEQQAPYRIELIDKAYELVLTQDYAAVRDRFYGEVREAQLNQSAIDVLSIVAYQQPITKAEIEAIRQKPSGAILSQLVERQLLSSEREEGSKVARYSTSPRFLELLGLQSVEDLPQAQEVDDIDEFFDELG